MQKSGPGSSTGDPGRDFPIAIATMRAKGRQRKIALLAFLLLLLLIAITLPFAHIQLARIDAFVPVIQTVMCLADFLTAVFLFAQYSIRPQPAVLVLAGGFIFSGLFAFLQTLAFPGAYAPAGLIGDKLNSPGWLFVLWHTSFPSAVIVYALSKATDGTAKQSVLSNRGRIGITLACVATVAAGLTWLATAGAGHLPRLYSNELSQTPFANYVNVYLSLLSAAALVSLYARRRTVLDQWLMVTLLAWLPNFVVSILFTVVRFTIGWYVARLYALIAGSSLLFVLLFDTVVLYGRLANTIVLLRRERETKLMSAQAITAAIAHEIRQPLTRITAGGGAAQRFLEMVPPQYDKAKAALAGVVNAGHSTSRVIDGFRSLFNKPDEEQELVDMNEVIPEVLNSLESQLDHRVSIHVDLTPKLPLVSGNKGQLQEVVSNLIINSIEAMEATTAEGRMLLIRTEIREGNIAVAVEDSGPGITKDQLGNIFTAFVTTKPHGMGLGLAISRMIIDYHGGKLTAASDSKAGGASFQFVLPTADRR